MEIDIHMFRMAVICFSILGGIVALMGLWRNDKTPSNFAAVFISGMLVGPAMSFMFVFLWPLLVLYVIYKAFVAYDDSTISSAARLRKE